MKQTQEIVDQFGIVPIATNGITETICIVDQDQNKYTLCHTTMLNR
jgi:hypothetical protein